MKLIENWGTGLKRVQREITEFGLREPEFIVSDNMFRVNIYRMSLDEFGEKLHPTRRGTAHDGSYLGNNGPDEQMTDNKPDNNAPSDNNNPSDNKPDNNDWVTVMLEMLVANPSITQAELVARLGVARSTLTARLAELQTKVLVRRVGARKNGYWEVLEGGGK